MAGFGLQGLGGGSDSGSSLGFLKNFSISGIWDFLKQQGWYNCLIGGAFIVGGIMFLYNI